MDELLFPSAAFFLSDLGFLQLQDHISLQKGFKPGCLWVSEPQSFWGWEGPLEIVQASSSAKAGSGLVLTKPCCPLWSNCVCEQCSHIVLLLKIMTANIWIWIQLSFEAG